MKTFLTDIFPRIQRFSENLDNITLLTNKHWVSIDNISSTKTVFIFRTNNELLVSTNGIVARERWEYLGNKSFLINMNSQCYLLKHSFFDGNIMALKIDSKEEYAVFVNENKYDGELNSIDKVFDFLRQNYIHSTIGGSTEPTNNPKVLVTYKTDKGEIEVLQKFPYSIPSIGNEVFQNDKPISSGKFRLGFMWYIYVENGKIMDV
jgi:hypothetical protein